MRLRFFAVLAALVLICGVMAACAKKPETPAEFLSLGEKYLTELDYEQAVVQFLKVIEIEPMNARAYILAAEAYIGLGQTNKAVEVLERGLQALPDNEEIRQMLEGLRPKPEPEPTSQEPISGEPEQMSANVTEYLQTLYALCETGDREQMLEAMSTLEFEEVASMSTINEPVLYFPSDDGNGKGLGIYANYLYFGDYAANERSGSGIWLWMSSDDGHSLVFEGQWSGDKPNGHGEVWDDSKTTDGWIVSHRESGELSNGLWQGETQRIFENRDGGISGPLFILHTDGIPTVRYEDKNNAGETEFVIGVYESGDKGLSISENSLDVPRGVIGFTH